MSQFDAELKKMMQETVQEMGDYFKQFEEKVQANQQKFETIQQKLYSYIENKCNREVEWLKNNSNNPSSDEFQGKLKEFEQCASQYDFGMSSFMKNLQKDQESYMAGEEECVMDCKNNQSNDIKNCLKKCLITSTNNFSDMYSKIDDKLNEINKKL